MKRLARIKKDIDAGRLPVALTRLVKEYKVDRQRIGIEWTAAELAEAMNCVSKSAQRRMKEKIKEGTWNKRKARTAKGNLATVYFEVTK